MRFEDLFEDRARLLWEQLTKAVTDKYTKSKKGYRSNGCKTCGGPLFRRRCYVCYKPN